MSRPKVFFVHQPMRYDRVEAKMVPLRNLESATEYGDIVFALPGTDRPSMDPRMVLPELRAAMSTFTPDDYIALAGDLHLVVWASVMASRMIHNEPLQLLKWSARTGDAGRYVLFTARV